MEATTSSLPRVSEPGNLTDLSARPKRALRTRNPTTPPKQAPKKVPNVRVKALAGATLTAADLSRLTRANTRLNEKRVSKLKVEPVHLDYPRPPSPTHSIPRRPEFTARDEAAADRNERARKRARLLDSDDESVTVSEATESEQEEKPNEASSDTEAGQWYTDDNGEHHQRHRRAAGDESPYRSPVGTSQKGRGIRWAPELFLGPGDRHAHGQRIRGPQRRTLPLSTVPTKGALASPYYPMDCMGNWIAADTEVEPAREVVLVQRRAYVDD